MRGPLGTGWWANVLSTFFGALAFGGVLCLYFPQQLTTPELRAFLRQTIMPFFKPNEKRLESQGRKWHILRNTHPLFRRLNETKGFHQFNCQKPKIIL